MQPIRRSAPIYTWLPEYYLIELEHVVMAPDLRLFSNGAQFEGTLMGRRCEPTGNVITPFRCSSVPIDPCEAYTSDDDPGGYRMCAAERVTSGKAREVTRLPLLSILHAAGVPSLDVWNGQNADGSAAQGLSPEPGEAAANTIHTIREYGAEVVLQIEYRNDA